MYPSHEAGFLVITMQVIQISSTTDELDQLELELQCLLYDREEGLPIDKLATGAPCTLQIDHRASPYGLPYHSDRRFTVVLETISGHILDEDGDLFLVDEDGVRWELELYGNPQLLTHWVETIWYHAIAYHAKLGVSLDSVKVILPASD